MSTNKVMEILNPDYQFVLSKYDRFFLEKSIQKRIDDTGCGSVEAYLGLLNSNKEEERLLVESMQINYSEFFRNPLTFAVLEKLIFPALMKEKAEKGQKEIRIWSSACAKGQEAYSIAMILEELCAGDNINYRIIASDAVENNIEKAERGMYFLSELNYVNMERLSGWFIKKGELYGISDTLKRNIQFSCFDCFSEQYSYPPESVFGDFDLILCANLLFYYQPEYRLKIIDKVVHSISENGFVVTGDTEREIWSRFGFQEIYPQSAIFRRLIINHSNK